MSSASRDENLTQMSSASRDEKLIELLTEIRDKLSVRTPIDKISVITTDDIKQMKRWPPWAIEPRVSERPKRIIPKKREQEYEPF
jgi:hypothetical protein